MGRLAKISLLNVPTASGPRWKVRFLDPVSLKISNRFFRERTGREGADHFISELQNQNRDAVGAFARLDAVQQAHLMAVWREAQLRGVDLMAGVIKAQPKNAKGPTLGQVIAQLVVAKREAGKDGDYVAGLENLLNRFANGCEDMDFKAVGLMMVKEFLSRFKPECRPTYRSRLATLFKFGMVHGYRENNPCDALELVKLPKKLPQVLTVKDTVALVNFLVQNPFHPCTSKDHRPGPGESHPALAWFILTTFAGLRPQEAMLCDPELHLYLDAQKPYIEITPDICKTGQWRIVYPLPIVVEALRWALQHGSELPLPDMKYRRVLLSFRERLNWTEWPQSITRHSGSSYWLAMVNDARHVAEMLGHSERTARDKYKKPVEQHTAEKFFKVLNLVIN